MEGDPPGEGSPWSFGCTWCAMRSSRY